MSTLTDQKTKGPSLTTFTLLDLKRLFSDVTGLAFSVALPVLFFLLFGAIQEYSSMRIGEGNISAYVMIGMALYGAVTAACSRVGVVVVEQSSGWNRQLALTPLSTGSWLFAQVVNILVRATLPVVAVYITGMFTNAQMPVWMWFATGALAIVASLPFGLYGMVFGMLFRSDSAVGAASAGLVILAFLGNTFMPLPSTLLAFARFTPMYGSTALARYPLSEGYQAISDGAPPADPFLYAIVNVLAWTALFAGICWMLEKRQKGRR
jgi:ABC-2 type transport system permease protein